MSILSQLQAVNWSQFASKELASVPHPFSGPSDPLYIETRSQYSAGIFNPYIGTMSILFWPHMYVV